jgi:hypothetical protein
MYPKLIWFYIYQELYIQLFMKISDGPNSDFLNQTELKQNFKLFFELELNRTFIFSTKPNGTEPIMILTAQSRYRNITMNLPKIYFNLYN